MKNSIKNEQSSIEEAIKTMEHWIEYEKNNKEKINKADELINIQETILSDYKRVLKENEQLRTEVNSLKKENEELKSKLENKDKYFELITGLGYDYDGYYNRETSNGNIKGLADLMDELVQAARDGLNDIPYQK